VDGRLLPNQSAASYRPDPDSDNSLKPLRPMTALHESIWRIDVCNFRRCLVDDLARLARDEINNFGRTSDRKLDLRAQRLFKLAKDGSPYDQIVILQNQFEDFCTQTARSECAQTIRVRARLLRDFVERSWALMNKSGAADVPEIR
jgi:hypothetical protein